MTTATDTVTSYRVQSRVRGRWVTFAEAVDGDPLGRARAIVETLGGSDLRIVGVEPNDWDGLDHRVYDGPLGLYERALVRTSADPAYGMRRIHGLLHDPNHEVPFSYDLTFGGDVPDGVYEHALATALDVIDWS